MTLLSPKHNVAFLNFCLKYYLVASDCIKNCVIYIVCSFRFSGAEPVLRIFCKTADTGESQRRIGISRDFLRAESMRTERCG